MKKTILRCSLLFFVVVAFYNATLAQGQQPKIIHIQKFRPPAAHAFLGGYSGDSVKLSAGIAKTIIGQPLIIHDNKEQVYALVSYSLAYTRLGVTEDEQTGTVSPESDVVGDHFTSVPLPPVWVTNIAASLHAGEELHFYDILVKDSKDRLFNVPDLRILIR